MTKGNRGISLLGCLGLLVLILDSKTALAGTAAGVELCIRTLIPGLFPFLFLSEAVSRSLWDALPPLPSWLCRLVGLPQGSESLLIPGFLGGYPAGAQAVAQAWRQGRLDAQTAQRLLPLCSNPGPAFVFGILSRQFSGQWELWLLWLVQLASALLTAALFPHPEGAGIQPEQKHSSPPDLLSGSLRTMSVICGWVLLFRSLLEFLDRWCFSLLPGGLRPLLWGLLELSNGCCLLQQIGDEQFRFVLCSLLLSFGGLCVTMQILSLSQGLSHVPYFRGKLVQSCLSVLLSILLFRAPAGILPLTAAIVFLRHKKSGSNPVLSGV